MKLNFICSTILREFDKDRHFGLFVYLEEDFNEYKKGLYIGGKNGWEFLTNIDIEIIRKEINELIKGKVDVNTFDNKIKEITKEIDNKVSNSTFDNKIGEINDSLNNKVDNDTFDEKIGKLEGLDKYVSNAEENWTTSAIGGIPANKTPKDFEGKTISEMLDDILYPTISTSKTNPSVLLNYNGSLSTLFEVGTKIPNISDFSISTNRGTLTYKNSNGDKYYGGEFGEPIYKVNNSTPIDDTVSVYGNYVYSVSVYCGEGATPLNNKGEVDSNITAYSGGTLTSSKTFTALYSLYANITSISSMSKLELKDYYNGNVTYEITTPPEVINGDKFMMEIPEGVNIISIKQKNMTTNLYTIDVDMVDNGEVEYNNKKYKKYIRTKTGTDTLGQAEYQIVIGR